VVNLVKALIGESELAEKNVTQVLFFLKEKPLVPKEGNEIIPNKEGIVTQVQIILWKDFPPRIPIEKKGKLQ